MFISVRLGAEFGGCLLIEWIPCSLLEASRCASKVANDWQLDGQLCQDHLLILGRQLPVWPAMLVLLLALQWFKLQVDQSNPKIGLCRSM